MSELRCIKCNALCVAAVTCRSCSDKQKAEIERLKAENKTLKEEFDSGCHVHTIATPVNENGCCEVCGEDLNYIAKQAERIEELENLLREKIAIAKVSADNENYMIPITIKEAEQALKGQKINSAGT